MTKPDDEAQTDDSFTGLIARAKDAGLAFGKETDRLRDILRTLLVNAKHSASDDPLVDFMRTQLESILAGKTLHGALSDWEATRQPQAGEAK